MPYWTNFAKFGDPNGVGGGSLPRWPVYGSGEADVLELGTRIGPLDVDFERFRFIKSLRVNGTLPASWRDINVLTLA
jgi:carboxylesterase type B